MAFDQTTRNRLQKFVADARLLLSEEFTRQMQNDFGLDPGSGAVSSIDKLSHLNDAQQETAQLLRETMDHYMASGSMDGLAALERIVREQAFTVLNRLCALRMAEARGILIESVGNGYTSKGFQLYAHLAGTALGETGDSYRCYLFSIFDEFSQDLAVLFDRYSPMGRLFPRDSVLLELLEKINHIDIALLWAEDETIGWIYQYFNSKEERKKMRDASQAPRNSRELAVRNQFFTPRYVVEFLTDNTLGRIWYEMTQGQTGLKDSCDYLVRRPNEIFLEPGDSAPEQKESSEDVSQEDLLKQPVYIAFRPLKDPREIKMLDPACGSMHFGLYAFDLFCRIYEEAWEMEETGHWPLSDDEPDSHSLHAVYLSKEAFLQDIPRLIIEHNIHGVDIDPRAVQIAGLSLWLRAQRSWQQQGVKPADRPRIRKSNIVCAEPMPGEKDLLQDFANSLKPGVLGQLVEIIFEKMELAGEAGSLLKIEEEIVDAIEKAREEFNKELLQRKAADGYLPGMTPARKQTSLFDFADLPDKTRFWQTAEQQILDALQNYAEYAEGGESTRKRLFADDAVKGFAFIDLCRKRFDVVLMNPPFGAPSSGAKSLKLSSDSCGNLYSAFILEGIKRLIGNGLVGAITDRTFLLLSSYEPFRAKIIKKTIIGLADFDWGVLDSAQVATCSYIVQNSHFNVNSSSAWFIDCRTNKIPKENQLREALIEKTKLKYIPISVFLSIPTIPFPHWAPKNIRESFSRYKSLEPNWGIVRKGLSPGDSSRFVKMWWEIPIQRYGFEKRWAPYANGGGFSPFFRVTKEVVRWEENGKVIRAYCFPNGKARFVIRSVNLYGCLGLTFGKRGEVFNAQILPAGQTFSNEGYYIGLSDTINYWAILGYLNSAPARYLINMVCGLHKEVGAIKTVPIPDNILQNSTIKSLSQQAYLIARTLNFDETSPEFFSRTINNTSHYKLGQNRKQTHEDSLRCLKKIEYQINVEVGKCLNIPFGELTNLVEIIEQKTPQRLIEASNVILDIAHEELSLFMGYCFGRWDIRFTTGDKKVPELPDPFAPLPTCPLGTFTNDDGLTVGQHDTFGDYPLRISWLGILVNDEGHQEDIINRTRDAIEVIWKDKTNDIEQEACEILKVKTLREYFSKPTKFFTDHLKRYSKSRRQAPIYWPISTASNSYTLWLYYHRLTDQTLYTCINDFVEPKITQLSSRLSDLRLKTGRSKQEEKELEKLSDLDLELKDFRDELLRIAKFWKPNLNDGVQITAAPLWNLFRLAKWNKKLKTTWQKLEKGDFDWAHLAYSIWPERVIPKAHKDRSIAIAHDLEDDLWQAEENGSDRQGNPKYKWSPKELSKKEMAELLQHRIAENS